MIPNYCTPEINCHQSCN